MFHADMAVDAYKVATLSPAEAADHGNMTIALVKMNMDPKDMALVNVYWMPEFFAVEMPDALRKAIVARLRHDADKLESGELEQCMRPFI
jgi:hypothetical protein